MVQTSSGIFGLCIRFCCTHNCGHRCVYPCLSSCSSFLLSILLARPCELKMDTTSSRDLEANTLDGAFIASFCHHYWRSNSSAKIHPSVFDWNNRYSSARFHDFFYSSPHWPSSPTSVKTASLILCRHWNWYLPCLLQQIVCVLSNPLKMRILFAIPEHPYRTLNICW